MNSDLEEQMHIEDEYLNELNKMHNEISWFKEQLENTMGQLETEKIINQEKDKALDEKDKALDEKDKALDEKDKALDKKDKALDEKNKLIYNLAKILKENGLSNEEIHSKTGLSINVIHNL